MHGYLSVSSGSTLDLFVGGGGGYPSPSYGHQWNNSVGRLAKRRRGRARLNERDVVLGSSFCRSEGVGDGGKSVLQIDGEDVLTAAGGRARSPHVSSLNSNARHGSLSLSFNNGLCKGQHSKYFDPTACGMGGSTHSGAFGQHGLVVIELFPSPTESNLAENSSEANRISALPSELVERTSYLFLPSQPPLSQPTQRLSSGLTGAQPIVVLSPISSFLFTVFILCVGVVFIISICFYGYSPCDANENFGGGSPVIAIVSRLPLSVSSLPMAVATLVSVHADTIPRRSGGDDSVYMRVEQNSVMGDSIGLVV